MSNSLRQSNIKLSPINKSPKSKKQHIVGQWDVPNYIELYKMNTRKFDYINLNLNTNRFKLPIKLPKIYSNERRVKGT